MTREFENKIISNCTVDTRKYRYIYAWDAYIGYHVKRIALTALDTVAALNRDNWETCKVYGR